MQSKQRGFSVIEIVLAVIVVGLIGAVTWLFIQNNNKSESTDSVATKTSSPEPKPAMSDEQGNDSEPDTATELAWATYTPSGKQYSIMIPHGWTLHKKGGGDTSLYSTGSLELQPGTEGKVVSNAGEMASCGHFILDYLPYANKENWSDSITTNTGLSVQKSAVKDELGVSGGGMNYNYKATKGQKTIYISYATCKGGPDHSNVVEQAVKTLAIN